MLQVQLKQQGKGHNAELQLGLHRGRTRKERDGTRIANIYTSSTRSSRSCTMPTQIHPLVQPYSSAHSYHGAKRHRHHPSWLHYAHVGDNKGWCSNHNRSVHPHSHPTPHRLHVCVFPWCSAICTSNKPVSGAKSGHCPLKPHLLDIPSCIPTLNSVVVYNFCLLAAAHRMLSGAGSWE